MPGQTGQGVAGFVLAGGKSSRMGQDKAFAAWQGSALLNRALEAMQAVASSTRIVGAKAKFASYGSVIEDIFAERGPLGGLHAALSTSEQELNLVLAVDLPFASPALLEFLIECAQDAGSMATVPRLKGGWEPLCAVYRREFAQVAEGALKRGQNAVHRLLEDDDDPAGVCAGVRAGIRAITERELEAAGFAAGMFRNINTVMDLESCQDLESREEQGNGDKTARIREGLNSK